jgi:sugar phosphate isomerase/epimerase
MGITTASYWKRWKGKYSNFRYPPFLDVLDFMDHVRSLGIGSVQMPVEGWNLDLAKKVRATCESYGLEVEGSIHLPRAESDLDRFEHELRVSREAGIAILRTALGGRRYETFTRLEDFESWKLGALRSMELTEPVIRRMRHMRIGIENHKDLECQELIAALRRLSSPHIGACVDTGNSIALLEDPLEVVCALAPYAVTVHLKDMAAQETADGFLLAEVPLGQGFLDLSTMVKTLLEANPRIRFQLEMITRNPLSIPCLRPQYWATLPKKPGADLARMLTLVRTAKRAPPAAVISALPTEAGLELEEKNNLQSLAYAASALGFEAPKVHKPQDESHER